MNRAGVRPDESVCFKGKLRDADRHQLRRCGFGFEHAVAKEPAPEEDLVGVDAMPARHDRNRSARTQRFLGDLTAFLLRAETALRGGFGGRCLGVAGSRHLP